MKKKLLEMLGRKEARKKDLVERSKASTDINELKTINVEMESLNEEIADLRSTIAEIPDEQVPAAAPTPPASPEQRTVVPPQPAFNPLGSYQMAAAPAPTHRTSDTEDVYGTVEYRTAFMEYVKSGKVTPALRPEARVDAMTATTDVSAIIPSTILNEVIKKITVYGQVYARVRKLSVKGGVSVPILSLLPTATWIGETPTSDKKKVQVNTNITFSYYGLECKVSTSLLADTVTLSGFESTITDLIVEAMVKAMDAAIISGDGSGKFLGITVDTRVPAAQIVTLSSSEFLEWNEWKKKVFAKMPLSYKAGATFLMASGTFEGYIDGMVDANGQPIGRVNFGITDGAQERFGGKEVVLVEDDIIAPYDDAAAGDVVAIYCNLRNYAINSNLQMAMFRYLDHDTNEYVNKAILIADGKLIDPHGVVIIKKGA